MLHTGVIQLVSILQILESYVDLFDGWFIGVGYVLLEIINYTIITSYIYHTYSCPFCDKILTTVLLYLLLDC